MVLLPKQRVRTIVDNTFDKAKVCFQTQIRNYRLYSNLLDCLIKIEKQESILHYWCLKTMDLKTDCPNSWCILTGRFIWPSSNLLPAHKCSNRLQCSLFISLLYKRVLYCELVTFWSDEVVNKHHIEDSVKATSPVCRYTDLKRFL